MPFCTMDPPSDDYPCLLRTRGDILSSLAVGRAQEGTPMVGTDREGGSTSGTDRESHRESARLLRPPIIGTMLSAPDHTDRCTACACSPDSSE